MKSIKNILSRCLVGVLALGLASCDLEEYNPGGNSPDTVWNTEDGFKTLVNASYFYQRNFYGKEDAIFLTEAGTDLWFNQNRANYANQLTRYEGYTPGSSGTTTNAFRTFYIAISHVNAGLARINEVPFSNPEERNRKEGELRFLRGYYYWHVVETWGGIHLKLDDQPTFTAQRSSVEQFYDVIISDLERAVELLPHQTVWGTEYSRASKKSALGFLARALLSRAYYSPEGSPERTAYFTRARDLVVNQIIAENPQSRQSRSGLNLELYANYGDNFDPFNLQNARNHKEAMYIISNAGIVQGNPPTVIGNEFNFDNNANRLHLWYMTNYTGKPGLTQTLEYGQTNQQRLMPTLALLDLYRENVDSRYYASFQEVWLANTNFTWTATSAATHKKDPSVIGKTLRAGIDTALVITKRSLANEKMKPYIAIDRDSVYATSQDNSIKAGANFVRLKKFHDPNRLNATTQGGFNDIVLMRFAEMYLIAAEAYFQLGNTEKAAEYLNVLRRRAAFPGQEAAMVIEPSQVTLDFILDERARELAGEHIRWFDLKRTGTLVERIDRLNPDITAVEEYHRLRPVPQAQIDALLNGAEFGQNDGYN